MRPLLAAALLSATVAIASGCASTREYWRGYADGKSGYPGCDHSCLHRLDKALRDSSRIKAPSAQEQARIKREAQSGEKIIDGRVPQRAEGTCATDGPQPCEMPMVTEGWEVSP